MINTLDSDFGGTGRALAQTIRSLLGVSEPGKGVHFSSFFLFDSCGQVRSLSSVVGEEDGHDVFEARVGPLRGFRKSRRRFLGFVAVLVALEAALLRNPFPYSRVLPRIPLGSGVPLFAPSASNSNYKALATLAYVGAWVVASSLLSRIPVLLYLAKTWTPRLQAWHADASRAWPVRSAWALARASEVLCRPGLWKPPAMVVASASPALLASGAVVHALQALEVLALSERAQALLLAGVGVGAAASVGAYWFAQLRRMATAAPTAFTATARALGPSRLRVEWRTSGAVPALVQLQRVGDVNDDGSDSDVAVTWWSSPLVPHVPVPGAVLWALALAASLALSLTHCGSVWPAVVAVACGAVSPARPFRSRGAFVVHGARADTAQRFRLWTADLGGTRLLSSPEVAATTPPHPQALARGLFLFEDPAVYRSAPVAWTQPPTAAAAAGGDATGEAPPGEAPPKEAPPGESEEAVRDTLRAAFLGPEHRSRGDVDPQVLVSRPRRATSHLANVVGWPARDEALRVHPAGSRISSYRLEKDVLALVGGHRYAWAALVAVALVVALRQPRALADLVAFSNGAWMAIFAAKSACKSAHAHYVAVAVAAVLLAFVLDSAR